MPEVEDNSDNNNGQGIDEDDVMDKNIVSNESKGKMSVIYNFFYPVLSFIQQ